MIDDLAGSQPAQRSADPLDRGDGALCQVVAPGASHNIGDHQGCEGAENPGADTIEYLDADQPEAIVGESVECRVPRGWAGWRTRRETKASVPNRHRCVRPGERSAA